MRKLEWTGQAQDDLRAVDRVVAQRIYSTIRRYAETGSGDVKRLRDFGGAYRLRVGDWRVILRNEPQETIRIMRVVHRSDAYR